jgi:UDP-N-acetylglucosamine 2-epimerase (non-hydrolysing)
MERLEPVLLEVSPHLVLVPGDVNSTLAAALVAGKLGFAVGHIEAGLRSFDRTMPEEINRVLTDALSDLLFTHSPEAVDNLLREGIPADRIHSVGNTMIDTLETMSSRIDALGAAARRGLDVAGYLVVTLHRPALVDGPLLGEAVRALQTLADWMPIVFPVHPRTRATMRVNPRSGVDTGLHLLEPVGYVEFLSLLKDAAAVLTDSGGVQEEATYLGVPCFTLRDNTERPITCTIGTNTLLGLDPTRILEIPDMIDDVRARPRLLPDGWDGRAAERIVDVLAWVGAPDPRATR